MDKETLAVWGGLLVLIVGIGTAVYYGSLKSTVSSEKGGTTETQAPVPGSTKPVTNNSPENKMDNTKATQAIINTNYGSIAFEFDYQAPNTVANFTKLALEKFYDGIKFHRVIKGFMIQTGDPFSKDDSIEERWGTGGPGYKFNDELTGQEKYPTGTVAMANAGPNTNGSQFFIVTAQPEAPLPPSYTVFGHVTSGIEVALKIENVRTEASDRPVEPVIIQSVEIR